MRVGNGFDAHQLAPGRSLIIGGVQVPSEFGLVGHSDGDVLIHAIIDALLGAAGLGDIGEHFPSTDERYRGVSSRVLLRGVVERVASAGFHLENCDSVVVAEQPRLAPFRQAMIATLAGDLQVDPDRISVKAKTTDHLGFTGRGEGIAAWATVLVSEARH